MYTPPIEVTVLHGPRTTVAEVVLTDENGGEIIYTGDAKKHPKDRDDPITGAMYAVGRALKSLADDLIGQADGRVDNHG